MQIPKTRVQRPHTAQAYVDLVEQAIFEVEELRLASEYDMESMGESNRFLDELEQGVRALRQSMADGSYQFGRQDLPFMALVERQSDHALPFKYLFKVINETHKLGLDVDEA